MPLPVQRGLPSEGERKAPATPGHWRTIETKTLSRRGLARLVSR